MLIPNTPGTQVIPKTGTLADDAAADALEIAFDVVIELGSGVPLRTATDDSAIAAGTFNADSIDVAAYNNRDGAVANFPANATVFATYTEVPNSNGLKWETEISFILTADTVTTPNPTAAEQIAAAIEAGINLDITAAAGLVEANVIRGRYFNSDAGTPAPIANLESDPVSVKVVAAAVMAPDTTGPVPTVTKPEMPETDGNLVFTIAFNEAVTGFSLADIEVVNGEKEDFIPGTGNTYMVTVRPDSANAKVTVKVAAGAAMDDSQNDSEAGEGSFEPAGYVPTIAITAKDGTGDDDGKVIFTLTFSEAPNPFSVASLTVTGAEALEVSDLMKAMDDDMEAQGDVYMLTVTPTSTATEVMVSIASGVLSTGMNNDMTFFASASGKHTVTPTDTMDDDDEDMGPAAGQIGSKAYLVVVPPMHYADALPGDLAGKTKTEADMPDLVEFFTTGGTIDVVVAGNHKVIITEIMLARDLSRRGQTGAMRPEAVQWIELYNTTGAHIDISAIDLKFREESPATAMPENTTDRISNTVSGAGWAISAFESALSGETAPVAGSPGVRTVTAPFNSIRRVHKDNKQLQNAAEIQNGWLSSSWALTANTRVYRAGRIGTPGAVNRPTVFAPPVYVAPDMSVTFNEIANMSDDDNEWIELKGPADTNMRKYKISTVTGYNKDTNTGTENTIFQFPDNDDIKIPSTGILLLTDKSPVENKLEADLEDGVEKPVRYRIKTLDPLPNDGAFLLLLRNKDGKILDVAGHLAGLDDDDPYTLMWPLAANVGAAKPGRISALNKLAGGNVYKRARAIQGYLANKDDGKEPAFEGAGFTGIGYDRNVSPGNKEHHGTPGYDNGVQIGAGMEATDNVVISEVMYGDGSGNLPQWIEIQNRSHTNGVDLHNWKLYVVNHGMNADGSAFEGKVVDGIFLRNMKIPPRQTALVVSKAGQNRTQLPAHRVLNLKRKANDPLLSSKGFYLFLVANAHEGDLAKRQAGDDAGNLPAPKETATGDNIKLFNDPISTLRAFQGMDPAWELPAGINANDYRVSIVRKGSPKILNPDGTAKGHWVSSEADKRSYNLSTSYGRQTDVGTPGNTPGAPLPVSLSKFRPERLESGEIVVRWITESELNNAGFNILRSETRDGEFSKINTSLIEGQGTTSERTTYSYTDKSAKPNVVYYYQIQDISLDGKVTTLRQSRLKGDVSPAGKLTTTWGELKALQ